MAVEGSQEEAQRASGVTLTPAEQVASSMPASNASRAGSVKYHNLQVAEGRWCGYSVFPRYFELRLKRRPRNRPPPNG